MGTDERQRMRGRTWESDMEAVEQIKVKLSAFTYLDERFESACLIISSPFFICTPFNPDAAGREESPPPTFFFPCLLAITLSRSRSVPPLAPLHRHPSPSRSPFRYPGHYHTLFVRLHLFTVSPLHPPSPAMFYACEDGDPHVSGKNARAGMGACVREPAAQKVHC